MVEKDSYYRYALNKDGQIVHVSEVSETNRREGYRCVSCGCELIPALGEKNAHHFRHKTDSCSYESYIHKLWKHYIYEQWHIVDHFYISYNIEHSCDTAATCKLRNKKCNKISGTETIDLKALYDTCEIEGTYGGYRADLLLTNSNNPQIRPMFIEIFYKHPCDDEKRSAGIQIVEIKVTDDDLQLPQPLIEASSTIPGLGYGHLSNLGIYTFGFNRKREVSHKIKRFIVYQDENGIVHGKVDDAVLTCRNLDEHLPNSMVEIFGLEDDFPDQHSFYKFGITVAARNNIIIRHCLHCMHYGQKNKTCELKMTFNDEAGSMSININDLSNQEFDKTNYTYFCKYYTEVPLWNEKSVDTIPHKLWRNKNYILKTSKKPERVNCNISKTRIKELAIKHK